MQPGAVVGGRFRLDSIIGVGGMGTVWSATHTITHKPVALKFLRAERADATLRQRFLREARTACAVHHPNVAEVHDVFETDDGTPLMVMELLEGETLATRLDREKTLPLAEVARIMVHVTSAVGTAHNLGIVHRDLKPENIFLARAGEGQCVVKILDFGIAKLTAADGAAAMTSELTTDGNMLGTPYYMSPEQADGEKDIDHRSDIWSLGLIFYVCLSGVLPTAGPNIGQVFKSITRGTFPSLSEKVANVPDDIVTLVRRMTTRDRAERPQSMNEVLAALQPYSDEQALPFGEPTRISGRPSAARTSIGPLRITPLERPPNPVSPLAQSLGQAETLEASAHSLALPKPRLRASLVLWVLAGLSVVSALAVFAGRALTADPAPARPEPAPVLVGNGNKVFEASSTPEPRASAPMAVPESTALATDAAPPAPRAAAPSPSSAGASRAPKPKEAPSSSPSGAPSASARPGGLFEQLPF
jgi:eukaryotic-like serine/threonine-protein kinase